MTWWIGAALAADAVVAVKVVGPSGSVAFQDELVLPARRAVPSPDGKHALGLYVATYHDTRAVVELYAGKMKDGNPIAKVENSFEIDPYVEETQTLLYRGSTWTVTTKLGTVWDAPAIAETTPDTHRYVLAWDDAKLLVDPKDPKKPIVQEVPAVDRATAAASSPMRVVDTWAETHLEVETVPNPGVAHCQAGSPPLQPYPLQHYVALTDVVRNVTKRELAARLADGTGYRVAAGVPLVAEGEGTWRVTTGGLSFLVQATPDDLAFFYQPSPHFTASAGTDPGAPDLSVGAPLSLSTGALGKTALGEVTWTHPEPIPVVGMRGVQVPLATVRVPCAEVRLVPDPARFVAAPR